MFGLLKVETRALRALIRQLEKQEPKTASACLDCSRKAQTASIPAGRAYFLHSEACAKGLGVWGEPEPPALRASSIKEFSDNTTCSCSMVRAVTLSSAEAKTAKQVLEFD